jgi:hypothetical protein
MGRSHKKNKVFCKFLPNNNINDCLIAVFSIEKITFCKKKEALEAVLKAGEKI